MPKAGINWVEALPRALRIHHDAVDPVTGASPYQIMFGRHRALAALPWSPVCESEDAEGFFQRIEELDREVARARNEHLEKVAFQVNKRRHIATPYNVGDWVYLRKPKQIGGRKLEPWWDGPYQVHSREGLSSYKVKIPGREPFGVHATDLKGAETEPPLEPVCAMRIPPLAGQEAE